MPVAVMGEDIMAADEQMCALLPVSLYALSTTVRSMAHTHMTEIGIAIRAVSTGTITRYAQRMAAPFLDCTSMTGLGIIAPTIRIAAVGFAEDALVIGRKNAK